MSHFDTGRISADWLPKAGTKWCEYEKKGLEIRRLAGCQDSDRLDPYRLAEILRFRVIPFSRIEGLSPEVVNILIQEDQWSGAALEIPEDGTRLIIINDRQSPNRQRATLMEEITHLILGHPPSLIKPAGRSYQKHVEEEAYAIGAASLVPFKALSEMLSAGHSLTKIARWFDVSNALVEYRMKVLGLWKD